MAKTACTLLSALVIIAFSMTCELGDTGKPPTNDNMADPTSS